MTALVPGGILRAASRIASTIAPFGSAVVVAMAMVAATLTSDQASGQDAATATGEITQLESYRWGFGRATDENFDGWPDDWQRYRGIGYPKYVHVAISAHDPKFERQVRVWDTSMVRVWQGLRDAFQWLPSLPPAVLDAMIDRYLRIDLDGGQVRLQSPRIAASRIYQYRLSCRVMTQGLRHDSARVEFVFLGDDGKEIIAHSTPAIRGTTNWTPVTLDLVRPPIGAEQMMVRLIVERSKDGLEDIRGTIGFDDIRIDQYPQLRITTDKALGIYARGRSIQATAEIMGLPTGASKIQFRVFDNQDREIAAKRLAVRHQSSRSGDTTAGKMESVESKVSWRLPRLDPGFYRLTASLLDKHPSTLATETTVAVIDEIIGGPPHGCFGWSLPDGTEGIPPTEFAPWLADLGVAWVKYPCWLAPDDAAGVEEIATIFSKLHDSGIQTVGVLDVPPDQLVSLYGSRASRDMVAAQLFGDVATWQPQLEPVMTQLTLKVRSWQLGADRDHSFLGRPRLRESISQIASGLQGFGQPIDVAISWPWLENELPAGESSWQAICRSTDLPLSAQELDSFLSHAAEDSRGNGPKTWLLMDPISASKYDRESRVRDLVLRMATVRSHRVQAAFVSNPRDPEQGLLKRNGRPDELLLPWRTTSRLIGNLHKIGSLQLRCGAENLVFAGHDSAVLMLWSAESREELIYLGDNIQSVDVWGKVTTIRTEANGDQPVQRIKIGRVPIFIIGADPTLLAFRMSVDVEQKQLDSFLGQVQKLSVSFANPTGDSLVGEMRILSPQAWTVNVPSRSWEALARRSATHTFDIVLGNTAKIGQYELPIQFEIDTVPPTLITVYRTVNVGPEGLEMNVTTRLLRGGELRVQIEITNNASRRQSYDCMLFPPPGRQYQRRFLTMDPGETVRREIDWADGYELVGKRMLLRAVEQDGRRVLNYSVDVSR